jgi:hypothetical protein
MACPQCHAVVRPVAEESVNPPPVATRNKPRGVPISAGAVFSALGAVAALLCSGMMGLVAVSPDYSDNILKELVRAQYGTTAAALLIAAVLLIMLERIYTHRS